MAFAAQGSQFSHVFFPRKYFCLEKILGYLWVCLQVLVFVVVDISVGPCDAVQQGVVIFLGN
jgi:hypothetical protein